MALAQVLLNGLLLGGIYACIGAGFCIVCLKLLCGSYSSTLPPDPHLPLLDQ